MVLLFVNSKLFKVETKARKTCLLLMTLKLFAALFGKETM